MKRAILNCVICQVVVPLQGPQSIIHKRGFHLDLNRLYETFCKHFSDVPTSSAYTWDFYVHGFPFCSACIQIIDKLNQLDEQLESVQTDIVKIISSVSSIILRTTTTSNTSIESQEHVTLNSSDNEYQLINQQLSCFRSSLCKRFTPHVVLKDVLKIDDSSKYQEIVEGERISIISCDPVQEPLKFRPVINPYDDLLNFNFDNDNVPSSSYPQSIKLEYYNAQNEQQQQIVILQQSQPIENSQQNSHLESSIVSIIDDGDYSHGSETENENDSEPPTKRRKLFKSKRKNVDKKSSKNQHIPIPRRKRNTKRTDLGGGKYLYGKWPFESVEGNKFKCSTCEIQKDSQNKVLRHIMEYHMEENKFTCQVQDCNRTVGNLQAFLRHQSIHADQYKDLVKPEIIACGPQKWLFDEAWIYEETDNGSFKCLECGEIRKSQQTIITHLKKRHKETSIRSCETCGKEFKNNIALAAHQAVHGDKKKKGNLITMSEVDGKYVYRGWEFEVLPFKGDREKYRCCSCGDLKASQRYMTRHIRRRHIESGRAEKYLCKLCGKSLSSSQALLNHEKNHDRPGRKATWKCENGKFLYDGKWPFEKTENGFKCGSCDASVKFRHAMYQHLLQVHLNPGGYNCPICNRKFAQKPHLTRHMTMHSDARPFQCHECGDVFRTKDHLTQHKQTHLTWICSVCNKQFKFKKSLHGHLRKLHSISIPISEVKSTNITASDITTTVTTISAQELPAPPALDTLPPQLPSTTLPVLEPLHAPEIQIQIQSIDEVQDQKMTYLL